MRPVVTGQNPLRYRLNRLLGAEAHVRLLRVLADEADGPLTASDLAERAGLTPRGARKALERLLETGGVRRVGGGRRRQFELDRSDPLVRAVQGIFRTERNRYDAMIRSIRDLPPALTPFPHSVWIEEIPGRPGGPLILGVLHDARDVAAYVRQLRTRLHVVEEEFDLTIEVNGYTKADLPGREADGAILLYGVLPSPEGSSRSAPAPPRTHEERDRRSLDRSRRIAEAIGHDASLVRRAKEHVDRLLSEDQGAATGDIAEWRDILEQYSIRRLSRFLTSTSERANRLRQSNPFLAVLRPDERSRILDERGREP